MALGIFPSVWQRSLYNEPGLRAEPWWNVDDTEYMADITRIEKSMDSITRYSSNFHYSRKMFFDGGTPIFLRIRNLISSTKHAMNLLVWGQPKL